MYFADINVRDALSLCLNASFLVQQIFVQSADQFERAIITRRGISESP